jgi:NAD(P)-dependent dehydrogenase (short-subunit alcohol dehydrogenase family)
VFDSTDVSTFAGGRALVQRAVDEFGTVDALALLAGRIPLIPLADVSEDEWDGVISSYLKGHYHPHPGGRTRHVRRSAMAASSGSRLYRALSATPTRRRTARPRPESSA